MTAAGAALIGLGAGVALLVAALVVVGLARKLEKRAASEAGEKRVPGEVIAQLLPEGSSLKALMQKHVLASADDDIDDDPPKTATAKATAKIVNAVVGIGVVIFVGAIIADIFGG